MEELVSEKLYKAEKEMFKKIVTVLKISDICKGVIKELFEASLTSTNCKEV